MVIVKVYLGAGKHPSPLEKTKTNSPNHYLTVVFYRIKKYCSYQKLLRFKDCSTRTPVTSCQPPIDRYFGRVHIDIHIDISDKSHSWLANSSPLEVTRVPL